MGVSPTKKVKLASFQLKDVNQIFYEQLKDSRLVIMGPIEWVIIKSEFEDWFFPRSQGKEYLES